MEPNIFLPWFPRCWDYSESHPAGPNHDLLDLICLSKRMWGEQLKTLEEVYDTEYIPERKKKKEVFLATSSSLNLNGKRPLKHQNRKKKKKDLVHLGKNPACHFPRAQRTTQGSHSS